MTGVSKAATPAGSTKAGRRISRASRIKAMVKAAAQQSGDENQRDRQSGSGRSQNEDQNRKDHSASRDERRRKTEPAPSRAPARDAETVRDQERTAFGREPTNEKEDRILAETHGGRQ